MTQEQFTEIANRVTTREGTEFPSIASLIRDYFKNDALDKVNEVAEWIMLFTFCTEPEANFVLSCSWEILRIANDPQHKFPFPQLQEFEDAMLEAFGAMDPSREVFTALVPEKNRNMSYRRTT